MPGWLLSTMRLLLPTAEEVGPVISVTLILQTGNGNTGSLSNMLYSIQIGVMELELKACVLIILC